MACAMSDSECSYSYVTDHTWEELGLACKYSHCLDNRALGGGRGSRYMNGLGYYGLECLNDVTERF